MEKVTPLDLEHAQLPRAFRGYSMEAVDRILTSASRQLEAQIIEMKRLQTQLKVADDELARFRAQEATLNSALLLAQKAADETRALARKEADLIVEEARQEAKGVMREAHEALRNLKWEAERLARESEEFKRRFRSLTQECQARIDEQLPTHAVLQVEQTEAATG